jgi:hypothetical protein
MALKREPSLSKGMPKERMLRTDNLWRKDHDKTTLLITEEASWTNIGKRKSFGDASYQPEACRYQLYIQHVVNPKINTIQDECPRRLGVRRPLNPQPPALQLSLASLDWRKGTEWKEGHFEPLKTIRKEPQCIRFERTYQDDG